MSFEDVIFLVALNSGESRRERIFENFENFIVFMIENSPLICSNLPNKKKVVNTELNIMS